MIKTSTAFNQLHRQIKEITGCNNPLITGIITDNLAGKAIASVKIDTERVKEVAGELEKALQGTVK